MFSISVGCCMGKNCFDAGNKEIKSAGQKAIIADSVLAIIFGIFTLLGFTGVLPQTVGITFCVINVVHVILMTCMKKCVYDELKSK